MTHSLILSTQLRSLILPRDCRRKRVSSWDTTGANEDFWKLAVGETKTLAELKGAGYINHIWMTYTSNSPAALRRRVLRMFWDGEDNPSVEVPFGDFFGVGHGLHSPYESAVLSETASPACNCWWPMPFARGARIEVVNEDVEGILYFYIDYEEYDQHLPEALYFHAQYRQEYPCDGWAPGESNMGLPEINNVTNLDGTGNYVILQAEGHGHYVGCNLSIHNEVGGWWGEGDDMIFIDDDTWPPSLHGTGSEDYFCHAYGMQDQCGPYSGTSLFNKDHKDWEGKWTVYRWHIPDPITFQQCIKVTIEHGHANCRCDDYSSVAYWYQTEPHKPFPPLSSLQERLPRDVTL